MNGELKKLSLNDMSQLKVYKIFGLKKAKQLPALTTWLDALPPLNETEQIIAKHYQARLIENVEAWNEQELALQFIGPIFAAVDFTVLNKLNFFSQRQITAQVDGYSISGKPDGIIASGYLEPEVPFFCFQEFKRELDNSGDPIGQNLAAMLIGQTQNESDYPIYGCYVVGRWWFFMVLHGKEYAISKAYSAAEEDIFEIIQALKALRAILLNRIGLTGEEQADELLS